ncbi:MAG TPA: hypothetical protein VGU01_15695 [Sphingomicrobium sp.]|nr:hypothetical protein [Sphingomicrobium sp.]
MLRTAGAIIGGLIIWVIVVTLLNFGLRAALPHYHAAEATLQFTAAMKAGRLIEAGLSSIIAGAVTRWIAPSSRWAPAIVGVILLALFVPVHFHIWNKLPVWYHLTFLLSLVPFVVIGALIPFAARGMEARKGVAND